MGSCGKFLAAGQAGLGRLIRQPGGFVKLAGQELRLRPFGQVGAVFESFSNPLIQLLLHLIGGKALFQRPFPDGMGNIQLLLGWLDSRRRLLLFLVDVLFEDAGQKRKQLFKLFQRL